MHEASSKTSAARTGVHRRMYGILIFDFLGGQSGGVCDSIHASQKEKTQKYMGDG